MKTAISIPDKVFEAAERAAAKLGISRSELYVNAVREYVEKYGQEDVTEKLNTVYGTPSIDSGLDPVLTRLQSDSLSQESW